MAVLQLSNFKHSALVLFLLACLSPAAAEDWTTLELEGRDIEVGTKAKFPFIPDTSFEASYLNMPVFVAHGAEPGPILCITAGVHGDELNGVEVARRVVQRADPESMRGTLIALPAINAEGGRTGSRYLADRRDLNRAFPGREAGSVATLIANAVFRVISRCDALVDLQPDAVLVMNPVYTAEVARESFDDEDRARDERRDPILGADLVAGAELELIGHVVDLEAEAVVAVEVQVDGGALQLLRCGPGDERDGLAHLLAQESPRAVHRGAVVANQVGV